MRRVAIFLLIIVATITGQVASSGDEIEWRPIQWSPQQYVINILGLAESDISMGGNAGSILQYNSPTSTGYVPIKCEFYGDSICTSNRLDLQASVVMPKCEGEATSWCIRQFSAIDSTGHPVTANFIKYVDGSGYPKNSDIGLPEGGRISIWRISNQKDSDPIYYALKFGGSIRWLAGKPFYFQTSGIIYPIRIDKNLSYRAVKLINSGGGINFFQSGMKCENAIYVQDGECGVLDSFPENIGFNVSFVVPTSITGFLSARIMKSDVVSSQIDSERKLITIQGSPLRIPRLGLVLTRDQALELNPDLGSASMNYMAFDNRQDGHTFKILNNLRNWSGDKSTGNSRVWNFTTLDSSNSTTAGFDANGKIRVDYVAKCKVSSSLLLGSVSTNSMVLDPGPPNFVDNEFVYNVAGMHYETDGVTPFKGYYSLRIAKSLAKCLYSNSGVPIRASVSIADENGVSQSIRTETIKDDGDYYTMELAGFTFSNPIIRVKYEFEEAVKTIPTPVAVNPSSPAAPTAVKKLTITCIKGKLIRKVTAIKPVCPKGFKKQSGEQSN
jgi:hypothetical protein